MTKLEFCKALAQRWQLAKKVSFVQCAAEEALAAAKDFGGKQMSCKASKNLMKVNEWVFELLQVS